MSSSSKNDGGSCDADGSMTTKRPKTGPTSFVTWNCNGLVSRCKWNKDQLHRLLQETQNPDVICLQEVRLKATNPSNRGTPLPADYKASQECMEKTVFSNYQPFWSLASTKYSGTCTLLHKRLRFDPSQTAFTPNSAISLLLKKYNLTCQDVGISLTEDTVSTSSQSSTTKDTKTKQTSMKSFFAPKKATTSAVAPSSFKRHHEEGRFQFFAFDSFDLINTYVPNNGTKVESFARRRKWDEDMLQFLQNRRKLLEHVASAKQHRPLLWCGDMNVAKDYRDGSHWKKGSNEDGSVYEFWTDESQCFVAAARSKLEPNRHVDDQGIPSFTRNERKRFTTILQEGELSDVWRDLHPDGVVVTESQNQRYKNKWEHPNWTWRGHMSKDENHYVNKYQGKGQRLDYFLLSPSTLVKDDAIVKSCEILGYGESREGLFCGSDHCATMLQLKYPF